MYSLKSCTTTHGLCALVGVLLNWYFDVFETWFWKLFEETEKVIFSVIQQEDGDITNSCYMQQVNKR